MKKVYFDNAATTPMDPEVIEAIIPIMKENFGNPSSVHSYGRESRAIIEKSRKQVANYIGASPAEIFFTSGGTEADNMILKCAVNDLGVNHIITSPLEHHAVLHTAEFLEKNGVKVSYVDIDDKGYVVKDSLEKLLDDNQNDTILVSLMHANNEIGNLISLKDFGKLIKSKGAYFHSDTVQTMGHYTFNVSNLNVDFLTCSAHKFHGPKGIGFLYVNSDIKISPMITGGAQERNLRAGTENIIGIVGLTKAMEIAYRDLEEHQNYVQGIKSYMIEQLEQNIPGVSFNGDPKGKSLYTVLNVHFPPTDIAEMFLYNLDIEGIAASGGSACSSGTNVGSHVLRTLGVDQSVPNIRFSFSKFNTKDEVDYTINVLKELYAVNA
jgi:cysteine desulfurase